MKNHWAVGTVVKVSVEKISFSVFPSDISTKVFDGKVQPSIGVNDYVWFQLNTSLKVIARIYFVSNLEQPFFKDNPNSKFKQQYIFDAVPIGQIKKTREGEKYLSGVNLVPMVGDSAYYAESHILSIIFNSEPLKNNLEIGCLTNHKDIKPSLSGNKLLSGHMAIIGNTGSGKSMTMRKILQKLILLSNDMKNMTKFFVFDIHNDYSFFDEQKNILHKIGSNEIHIASGKLTLDDWESILLPSEKTQRPILDIGLKLANSDDINKLKIYGLIIKMLFESGILSPVQRYQSVNTCFSWIKKHNSSNNPTLLLKLNTIWEHYNPQFGSFDRDENKNYQEAFVENICKLCDCSNTNLEKLLSKDLKEDSEVSNSLKNIIDGVELAITLEECKGNSLIRSHTESLLTRLRVLDRHYGKTLFSITENKHSIEENLNNDFKFNIFDVSLFDDIVLKLLSSYFARVTFEHNKELKLNSTTNIISPIYLIFDEAHRYILGDKNQNDIFNRISREGRKFGVYLIVISQRPSELSKVVLSQIKTYFIHRIQNSIDIEFVRKNVSSITQNDVNRISSLPVGVALVVSENDYSYEMKIYSEGIPKSSDSIVPFSK